LGYRYFRESFVPPIFYEGIEGTPQCHFAERTSEAVITDMGLQIFGTGSSKVPELPARGRLAFEVELRLGSRARPIADPFKVAIKVSNSPHPPPPNPARNLPFVGRLLPDGENLVWSAESHLD